MDRRRTDIGNGLGLPDGRIAPCFPPSRRRKTRTSLSHTQSHTMTTGISPNSAIAKPKILGIAGWSGSGKTTLLTSLIPLLIASGLRVSTIKHAHHGFDLDHPGKDSWRHREAGAHEVMLMGEARWALLHEPRADEEAPDLDRLVQRMALVDVILVEGFRSYPHPKIEVYRPATGKPPLWPDRRDIVAVAASPFPPETLEGGINKPCFLPLDDVQAVANWTIGFLSRYVAPA
ncbi:Molybdopterin-guanine dinucleotide biosynthesis protein B [Granulibacter bethesdensis CGDNIH4]|nr:Molybdopterin-guanine dinucleotide biosynthesis protein B [Granulibacter bethesdensis CGDNIH4]